MIATRTQFQADAPEPESLTRVCEAEGCTEAGSFRAPKSRSALREFRWFCLPHVREYNASWDYYKDMSEDEIEANKRADALWQRPTWPLGRIGGTRGGHAGVEQALEDELHFTFGSAPRPAPAPPKPKLPAEASEALDVLGLSWPVTLTAVKAAYKKLAKRHHPDANNGDKKSEEMFKTINLAYTTLSVKFAELLRAAGQNAAPAE